MLLLFIVLSPLIVFLLAMVLMTGVSWIFRRSTPHRIDTVFRRLQLLSAAIYSLGHGGNDAQKTMGIIVMLLMATHGMGAQELTWWASHDPAWLHWLDYLNVFGHSHNV